MTPDRRSAKLACSLVKVPSPPKTTLAALVVVSLLQQRESKHGVLAGCELRQCLYARSANDFLSRHCAEKSPGMVNPDVELPRTVILQNAIQNVNWAHVPSPLWVSRYLAF